MENSIQVIRVTGLTSLARAPSVTSTIASVQVRRAAPAERPAGANSGSTSTGAALRGMLEVFELKLTR